MSERESAAYTPLNPERPNCEDTPYPYFAQDRDRGHEFALMVDGRYHCRFCGVDEVYWLHAGPVVA